MRRLMLVAMLASLIGVVSPSPGEEPMSIPLEEVWALGMPGTKKITGLDLSKLPQPLGTLSSGPLDNPTKKNASPAPPGFIVRGTGLDALVESHRAVKPGEKPTDEFRASESLSIVFSSRTFIYYVHLRTVSRKGKTFLVEYCFEPHETRDLSSHLALIPIGRLEPGDYRVDIKELPLSQNWTDAGFPPVSSQVVRSVVCSSFCFCVVP